MDRHRINIYVMDIAVANVALLHIDAAIAINFPQLAAGDVALAVSEAMQVYVTSVYLFSVFSYSYYYII